MFIKQLQLARLVSICFTYYFLLQRDQVQLQQRDIDNLREQLQHTKKENNYRDKDAEEKVTFWESQCKRTQQECKNLRDRNEDLEKELEVINVKCKDLDKMWQNAESTLIDTKAEVKVRFSLFLTI